MIWFRWLHKGLLNRKTRLISDKELYDYIVSLIKKATSDIRISSPWIYNCDHILDELVAAGGRGVKISVVMRQPNNDLSDKRNYQDKLNAIGKLKEAKADIIFDPYVHEKVVISDGKEMIVSSANLVGTSLTRNGESGTYTNDPQEIEKYQLRLAKKYSKKPVQQRQNVANIIRKPAIVAVIAIVVIITGIAVFLSLNPSYEDKAREFEPNKMPSVLHVPRETVSSLLSKKPLNQIVTVTGSVLNAPEDYTAKTTGNVFQQFYITDGSKQIKVFCSKDTGLKLTKNDGVEVTGKFILFANEYEVADLLCSAVNKK